MISLWQVLWILSGRNYIDISITLIQHDGKTYNSCNHKMCFQKEQYYQLLILLKITLSLHKRRYKVSIIIQTKYLYLCIFCIDMHSLMSIVLIAMKIIMKWLKSTISTSVMIVHMIHVLFNIVVIYFITNYQDEGHF